MGEPALAPDAEAGRRSHEGGRLLPAVRRVSAGAARVTASAVSSTHLHLGTFQAEHGDVPAGSRPMWSDEGGLDYQGQERYDAWSKAKVRLCGNDLSVCTKSVSLQPAEACEPAGPVSRRRHRRILPHLRGGALTGAREDEFLLMSRSWARRKRSASVLQLFVAPQDAQPGQD